MELSSGSAVLNGISKHFTEEKVYDLAAILLENKCPGGGFGFIEQHSAAFGSPNWRLMALKVLREWCDSSEEQLFGGDLLRVLAEVLPSAADAFRKRLLGMDT